MATGVDVRDSYLVYQIIRPMILFGVRVKPILDELDLKPGESILDAGCGYGELVQYFGKYNYTGIDIDASRIRKAKELHGENSNRTFLTGDINQPAIEGKTFDKALGCGLLHHLSDDEAKNCIQLLSRVVRRKIVFSDPVYSKYHFVSNLLCRMDRGNFVRGESGYRALCEGIDAKITSRCFHARSFVAKYVITSLEFE